ncbi:GroS Co-chaperonin GroES (HSP10) [uncultured Caudovirales phage]|jgi:co-chaperonin GroES (HSP10)|uniref:GroS Co-chaperonin GroES (HSP10) n=1 Tax=uncultured Caudovirales phage TaxID=2100421 RepID=A0A6J5LA41_9CAUD|nr:GroS Co-chaperonin GroES (HSP10) [uncultured Caudovirales phage]
MSEALIEAFPDAEPGIVPFGSRVLVQIRSPKTKTASGIILDNGTRDTEKWNTQVAKVVSVGALAFKNRNTMDSWPEGSWCKPGDFVRVAKYGGDRWEVSLPSGESALFVIFNDLDIIGQVVGDPLAIRAFI